MKRLLTTAALAFALAAGPVAAEAADVSRSAMPAQQASAFTGDNSTGIWIAVAVLAGLGLFLAFGDDDDDPDSP